MRRSNRSIFSFCLVAVLILLSSYSPAIEHNETPPAFHGYKLLSLLRTPTTHREPVITSDTASATLHFRRAGNLILVRAKADTTDGFFILDTGAPYLVLNMTYFRDYPATMESEGIQGGITGAASSFASTTVSLLTMGPFKYHQLHADRINLGHIEDSKGVKILGLIGLQLLKRFELIIDYQSSTIELHLIHKKETKTYRHSLLNDPSTYSTFPILIQEDKILLKATFGAKTLTFLIDTGAESNVIDSRLPNSILEKIVISRRVKLTGNGGGKVDALIGDINDLKIGNTVLSSLPVLVTNLEKMCSAYNTTCLDGMFGFDFLSLHKIGFNFVNRKMYIWK
jgi:predicted aspartyl protease